MSTNEQLPSGMRWMCNRNGCIAVADVDATTNCNRYPAEWTLERWQRPDSRPDVNIPDNWEQTIAGSALVDLARTTVNGRGFEIETAAQAYAAISAYLAGTQHPAAGKGE
jgi:hypothetical protein